MSFVINLFTVCMALCGILMPKGLKEKIGFWQLLDSTQCFELLTQDTWYHLLTENQWFQTIFSETDHLMCIVQGLFYCHKTDGKLLPNTFGFEQLSWFCFKWEHFEKYWHKLGFHCWGDIASFWKKTSKTTWQGVVIKPYDLLLQNQVTLERGDFNIFHLTPHTTKLDV